MTAFSPKTTYHYRFVAGDDVSMTGSRAPRRRLTRPTNGFASRGSPADWSVNHWQAMTLLADERDLDFVVHVGDYIYETVGTAPRAAPSRRILRCT